MASPDASSSLTKALGAVGFTELEAAVYADLVRKPGQTGYALAKRLGKGQPSIYSALANLEGKSAIYAPMRLRAPMRPCRRPT